MMGSDARFAPSSSGPTGLFFDSSALYAYFYPRDERHDDIAAFFEGLLAGEFAYRPLLTNDYVLDKVVTGLITKADHTTAVEAMMTIQETDTIQFLTVTDAIIEAAISQFEEYDDHRISFTDHVIAVHAGAEGVDHVLTYDGDFAPLGMTVIPRE